MQDFCSWCFDGGELLLCDGIKADGDMCSFAFCTACLDRNLGAGSAAAATASNRWLCLVCDPSPLENLRAACNEGRLVSMYNDAALPPLLEQLELDSAVDSSDFVVDGISNYNDVCRLKITLLENARCVEMLEQANLAVVEAEIRSELTASDVNSFDM